MKNRTSALEDEKGNIVGFNVGEKKFYADEAGRVEMQLDELKDFEIGSIPDGISIYPLDGNIVVFEGEISSTEEYPGIAQMEIHAYRKYWDHKFGALRYYNSMKEAIDSRGNSNHDVKFIELEDDDAHIFFRYEILLKENLTIDYAYTYFCRVVEEIENHTERILEKAEISAETLANEEKYTIDVLLPLFRTMGFIDVKYNHGNREFGKDITFSEIDKFGVRRNYGIQVKAGDVSGSVGSDIDNIIAQIEDAFSMPYVEITSREKRYVSDFIIAISGRFTSNSKDKILEKISRRNVYFLDIDKTQELIDKYMG